MTMSTPAVTLDVVALNNDDLRRDLDALRREHEQLKSDVQRALEAIITQLSTEGPIFRGLQGTRDTLDAIEREVQDARSLIGDTNSVASLGTSLDEIRRMLRAGG